MAGWHHRLNGDGFEQTPGDDEGQGRLACCSPWVPKQSDTTEHLNNNNKPSLAHSIEPMAVPQTECQASPVDSQLPLVTL